MQDLLTSLFLPPLLLVILVTFAGFLAWRGAPRWALVVIAASFGQMVLATPFISGNLVSSLEGRIDWTPGGPPPQAIVILSADAVQEGTGFGPGPLSLERLRTGARLRRETGLPVLVSGGPPGREAPSLGEILAHSLSQDFGVPTRWIESRSHDTRENALYSVEMLRAEGIEAVMLVTHGWHLPRAQDAFRRLGFVTYAQPVRIDRVPRGAASEWFPRPDCLVRSWYALREWLGRLVYELSDRRVELQDARP